MGGIVSVVEKVSCEEVARLATEEGFPIDTVDKILSDKKYYTRDEVLQLWQPPGISHFFLFDICRELCKAHENNERAIDIALRHRQDLVSSIFNNAYKNAFDILSLDAISKSKLFNELLPSWMASNGDSILLKPADELTTAEVCMLIVKPETQAQRCSLVTKLRRSGAVVHDSSTDSDVAAVGPASYFVSHAWSFRFLELCDALNRHFLGLKEEERRTTFWFLDIFCVNQWLPPSTGPLFYEEEFQQTIRRIGAVLSVCIPALRPVVSTRCWCLWELFSAILAEAKLVVTMTTTEFALFKVTY